MSFDNRRILSDIGEMDGYVAHLQLHMTLQARKLLPSLLDMADSRNQLLHQTQADSEKLSSRQSY